MNPEAAEQSLSDALAYLRALFAAYRARAEGEENATALPAFPEGDSPLQRLAARLRLSAFERDLLLLCAAVELDSGIAQLCGQTQSDEGSGIRRVLPTFSLALALLPEAHWTALHPEAPLRRYRLLHLVGRDDTSKEALTLTPLRIEEPVLHFLLGLLPAEERLRPWIEWLPPVSPEHMPIVGATSVEQLRQAWTPGARPRLALLSGGDESARRAITRQAYDDVAVLSFSLLVTLSLQERDTVLRLWEREVVLSASRTLLVEISDDIDTGMSRDLLATVLQRISQLPGRLILSHGERLQPFVVGLLNRFAQTRPFVLVEATRPNRDEQRQAWGRLLGTDGIAAQLVGQFDLGIGEIESIGASVLQSGVSPKIALAPEEILGALWDRCRIAARPRLEELAERVATTATWEDIVLPAGTQQLLQDIAAHTRARVAVADRWGFGKRGSRGLGISAVFSGPSGTGKTLAAEVLANELRLDLYRIDLSALVSKYIGETEKNLRRVFDAAEAGGALLLFDEADALFGKRSEVKDSHDRYANIEVSYLLQRMENYSGLAILTTNLKASIDTAFLRRLRFAVSFPFPDVVQRTRMWERAFPPETPTEGLTPAMLAQLHVAGGNIRTMALYAASLAADQGEPVRMSHLLRAARAEYAKLEKSLTNAEIEGWLESETKGQSGKR